MKATITDMTVNGQPGFVINYTTAEGVVIQPWAFTNNTSKENAFWYFCTVYTDAVL